MTYSLLSGVERDGAGEGLFGLFRGIVVAAGALRPGDVGVGGLVRLLFSDGDAVCAGMLCAAKTRRGGEGRSRARSVDGTMATSLGNGVGRLKRVAFAHAARGLAAVRNDLQSGRHGAQRADGARRAAQALLDLCRCPFQARRACGSACCDACRALRRPCIDCRDAATALRAMKRFLNSRTASLYETLALCIWTTRFSSSRFTCCTFFARCIVLKL